MKTRLLKRKSFLWGQAGFNIARAYFCHLQSSWAACDFWGATLFPITWAPCPVKISPVKTRGDESKSFSPRSFLKRLITLWKSQVMRNDIAFVIGHWVPGWLSHFAGLVSKVNSFLLMTVSGVSLCSDLHVQVLWTQILWPLSRLIGCISCSPMPPPSVPFSRKEGDWAICHRLLRSGLCCSMSKSFLAGLSSLAFEPLFHFWIDVLLHPSSCLFLLFSVLCLTPSFFTVYGFTCLLVHTHTHIENLINRQIYFQQIPTDPLFSLWFHSVV